MTGKPRFFTRTSSLKRLGSLSPASLLRTLGYTLDSTNSNDTAGKRGSSDGDATTHDSGSGDSADDTLAASDSIRAVRNPRVLLGKDPASVLLEHRGREVASGENWMVRLGNKPPLARSSRLALGRAYRVYSLDDYQMTGIDKDTVPDMYNELRLTGRFDLQATFPDGKVEYRSGRNLVTSSGESLTVQLLNINGAETAPNYMAFGSGTDSALKSDTQLQTEISADPRKLVDTTVVTSNTLAMTWNITIGNTFTINEMGIFNALTVGTMFSRFLTQKLNVVSGVLIDITWTLTVSGVD